MPAPAEAMGPPVDTVDRRVAMWRAELGYRGSFINDAGYGVFSTNQYLPQASLAASRTIWQDRLFSFAPGIGFDFGSTSASARGAGTSLATQRLSVPLEGRLHFGPWGYAFVRAAPGVALENAEVDDQSSPSPLKASAWMFSTDVSGGYAFLVTPRYDRFARTARLWIQGDVGYGWVAGDRLALTSGGGSGIDAIDLGTLTLEGGFFRVGAAVSF
jgi:hypothetical protein